MNLERELRELGDRLEWPPTPDVAAAVSARVDSAPARRRPWPRRRVALAVALGVVLAGLVATLAVPSARTAVLRWLGIGSVQIVHVDELPPVTPATGPLPGRAVSLAEARRTVPFPLLDPPAELGPPDRVLLLHGGRGATLVWDDGGTPRLAVTQLPGAPAPWLVGKLIPPGTSAVEFREEGRAAVWITGRQHQVAVLDPRTGQPIFDSARLAGNTLLVDRGTLTLRVEGDLSRSQALAIARGFD